jgi:hypothetical protein
MILWRVRTKKDLEYLRAISAKVVENYCVHIEKFKPFMGINCWDLNEEESLAMWQIYGEKHRGVVIESTYGRLVNSLDQTTDHVYIGMINYTDHFQTQELTYGNEF